MGRLSAAPMLVIAPSQVPPEGLDLRVELRPGDLHLATDEGFAFEGGSLHGRLERGDDRSVHVRGRLAARLGLQCGRCLEAYSFPLEEELDLFYLPHRPNEVDEEEDASLPDREVVVAYYEHDRLELGDALREQLYLALPMRRLCAEGCKGFCAVCGGNLNRDRCECRPEGPEPRLAPLQQLLERKRQDPS